jgi:hypothetical protein
MRGADFDQDDTSFVKMLFPNNPIGFLKKCGTGKRTLLIGSDIKTCLVDDTLHDFDSCVNEFNSLNLHFLHKEEGQVEGEGC